MSERKKELMMKRALEVARIILDTHATVRQVAKIVGVSKSTVHKDINERLSRYCIEGAEGFSEELVVGVLNVIAENKAVRHIRGGEATKKKYASLKKK